MCCSLYLFGAIDSVIQAVETSTLRMDLKHPLPCWLVSHVIGRVDLLNLTLDISVESKITSSSRSTFIMNCFRVHLIFHLRGNFFTHVSFLCGKL